jgi:hypothetical protein
MHSHDVVLAFVVQLEDLIAVWLANLGPNQQGNVVGAAGEDLAHGLA